MSSFAIDQIQAVVCDFDGTLAHTQIDFAQMRSRTVELIKTWGLWQDSMDQDLYILELIEVAEDRLAADPLRRSQFRREADAVLEDVEVGFCAKGSPFPGIPDALMDLANAGMRIGIITRNCRRAVEAFLARHPLYFDLLLTRDDVPAVKPDKGHLLAALEVLQVAPEHALLVGDHRTDIECGQAAGAFTCGVLTDRTTRDQFATYGADLVAADLAVVARFLLSGDTSELIACSPRTTP